MAAASIRPLPPRPQAPRLTDSCPRPPGSGAGPGWASFPLSLGSVLPSRGVSPPPPGAWPRLMPSDPGALAPAGASGTRMCMEMAARRAWRPVLSVQAPGRRPQLPPRPLGTRPVGGGVSASDPPCIHRGPAWRSLPGSPSRSEMHLSAPRRAVRHACRDRVLVLADAASWEQGLLQGLVTLGPGRPCSSRTKQGRV